jgi:hypothetical protein
MRCMRCQKEIGGDGGRGSVAAISGSINGDESSDVYYRCGSCGAYTVLLVHEPFLGEEQESTRGPLTAVEGEAAVALISRCDTPWDKKCRCPAHKEYFGDVLD